MFQRLVRCFFFWQFVQTEGVNLYRLDPNRVFDGLCAQGSDAKFVQC